MSVSRDQNISLRKQLLEALGRERFDLFKSLAKLARKNKVSARDFVRRSIQELEILPSLFLNAIAILPHDDFKIRVSDEIARIVCKICLAPLEFCAKEIRLDDESACVPDGSLVCKHFACGVCASSVFDAPKKCRFCPQAERSPQSIVRSSRRSKRRQRAKKSKKSGVRAMRRAMSLMDSWSRPDRIFQEPRHFRDIANPLETASSSAIIVWFRNDLRVRDNPALYAASQLKRPIIPVFVRARRERWRTLGASAYYQLRSLTELNAHLKQKYRSKMIFRAVDGADAAMEVLRIAKQAGASSVYTNRVYEPWLNSSQYEAFLSSSVELRVFKGASVLYEPDEARPQGEQTRLGFGSVGWFLRACQKLGEPPTPLPAPKRLKSPAQWPSSRDVSELGLYSSDPRVPDWSKGIREFWLFGEKGALKSLQIFLESCALDNFEDRKRLVASESNTSTLSAHIRFGEISSRYVYHAILRKRESQGYVNTRAASAVFLRRLAWRDLSYWSLTTFPFLADRSVRPQYENESWRYNRDEFERWARGKTGFPLVDACMRQLWHVGWMPNYLRHIAAQFLIEYMHFDWKLGLRWFHYTLVDADTAINAFMWQNGGHSGFDQWNFVMHPVFAAKSCDPDGGYVRRWVPELSQLPVEYIHNPWDAPATMLASKGRIVLGRTYPHRMIRNLRSARKRSHNAVMEVRRSAEGRKYVLSDGNEFIYLPDGRQARCITRRDFRFDEEEPVTFQTAGDKWDFRKRAPRSPIECAMRGVVESSNRIEA